MGSNGQNMTTSSSGGEAAEGGARTSELKQRRTTIQTDGGHTSAQGQRTSVGGMGVSPLGSPKAPRTSRFSKMRSSTSSEYGKEYMNKAVQTIDQSRSLFIFAKDDPMRMFVTKIVEHKRFDQVKAVQVDISSTPR